MRKSIKRFLAGIMTLAMLGVSGVTAFAADTTDTGTGSVTGTVAINGAISPLTISLTHPISAAYAIDPNNGTTGTLTAPDIKVTNNTKVAVNVTVASLTAASGGTLTFTDVDSASKSWSTLNLADSKKYIALGVRAKDTTGWSSGYNTATHWAVKTTPTAVGSLSPAATGTMTLTANHGLAFDSAYTANHSLVFLFQFT
ncbi:hypothetical protein [Faecalispora anaeroviscerum]|uniref:hypothetical protein n=1 Tax=Faecalispora anaeroviscerum TaxID=2991836 RepID=UPI0024B9CBD2|nr:hypothetical protein [Faecalispora anaeroviscerum]